MATKFGQNWQNDLYLAGRHYKTDRNMAKIFYGNIVARSYASLIKISLVTTSPFWMRRQKSTYLTKYLSNYLTDLHQLFSVGRHVYEDYKIDISFAVAQGMLLW